MRFSISRSRESIRIWLFWSLGIYLVLESGPFLLATWILRKTARDLAGPYLAFAVPWAILAPLIWWLRRWEDEGASPKRVARGWGLGMALFGFAIGLAVFYSGVELRLMNTVDAVVSLVATTALSAPIFYFGMYHRALTVISSRTSGKLNGAHLK
jgi:hypothetical protein